jgi:hypothetical protein
MRFTLAFVPLIMAIGVKAGCGVSLAQLWRRFLGSVWLTHTYQLFRSSPTRG